MNIEFPELHDFFGAYFHQDWSVEYESAEQVLEAFLAESDVEILKAVQQELSILLDKRKVK
ncbi:contact-dependent growth inhibition system immunity protein [Pseudomonas fluorescens]|uniref:contact-dependent growth inhibition system immunity protein n=1 Tax=Pseudomonas fluorescens TaxID=294 RepID=UPI001FD69A37|nr:contact-dependent growth inhibition system immunity protein [Pseudomonas fluorescens]